MKNESERTTNKINGGRNVSNLMCSSQTARVVMKGLFPYSVLQCLIFMHSRTVYTAKLCQSSPGCWIRELNSALPGIISPASMS